MSAVTIRNIPEATHRALKLRAAQHGRSTEAEIRQILENTVRPKGGMGTALAEIGHSVGGLEINIRRSKSRVAKASFE